MLVTFHLHNVLITYIAHELLKYINVALIFLNLIVQRCLSVDTTYICYEVKFSYKYNFTVEIFPIHMQTYKQTHHDDKNRQQICQKSWQYEIGIHRIICNAASMCCHSYMGLVMLYSPC